MKKTKWMFQSLVIKTTAIPKEQLSKVKGGHNGAIDNNDYSGPGNN